MSERKRRAPSIERKITEILPEKDIRVRLLGTVLEISDSVLLIDDGSGKVEVQFDKPDDLLGLERGQFVRVIARVIPLIEGFALHGEVVQDLSNFNMQLYKRAREIIER